jgi:Ca-activated chloride channel homolog
MHRLSTDVLLLSLALAAQIAPVQQPPERLVFSSRSDLVALHVTVLDKQSGFVAGLPRDAFHVYEDGRPQTVALFENTDMPVTVGVVMDNSGSMQGVRDHVVSAGMAFAHASHPEDEMFVVHFNERVWQGLSAGTPFTSDREELRRALLRSTARGQTALFDGILAGLHHLERGGKQKKVLVVISDGADNASRARFADVLDTALRMNALIHTIGLYDRHNPEVDAGVLRQLSDSTGGETYFPRQLDSPEVTRILQRIAHDIRSGYTIGYVPAAGLAERPGYRAVRVDVRSPDRRKLSVRVRKGYVAGPARSHGSQ